MSIRHAVALLVVSLATAPSWAQPLPNTQPLTMAGDLADQMVAGIDRFLLRETAASVDRRASHWKRDFSSPAAYQASIAPNRERLRQIIGAQDARERCEALEFVATTAQPALVGRGEGFEVFAVRWPVLKGITGEGLLVTPEGKPAVADCLAVPDADQTPEMLVGLVPGIPPQSQFARRLAESGCRVLVPLLIDRADTFSTTEWGHGTNQPHREYVYRPAFEMGRHVIGLEVQKLLAAVDWFTHDAGARDARIGVFGYGEGGLLAMYAAALDPRIDAAGVSGYFGPREDLWQEPIYRNVFGMLEQFGDAELASMVLPRGLVIEASRAPDVLGPPPVRPGHNGAAPGKITSPAWEAVEREAHRAEALTAGLNARPKLTNAADGFGTDAALIAFLSELQISNSQISDLKSPPTRGSVANLRTDFDPQSRLQRQFEELVAYTQALMHESSYVRQKFWAKADRQSRSVEQWQETTRWYRDYFRDEVIGRFDQPLLSPNARTRQIMDQPNYVGYEVVLDVFPDVFAYGILLLPKAINSGERRPVVVCQHGLEGRPQDVADPNVDHRAYHRYACQLADRGFIVFAPQNPYIFQDRFRSLQRKANPLKKTLFSVIVPQHQQITTWLASLPMVDPQRIAFYGLSYGGKTAMRVPALVDRYCLSICSADFNEWIWKNTSTRAPAAYVGRGEYEIFEFDLGNTYNYAEMAGLIAPRPFMVERGHRDGVAPDEWVAYEFAKVRLLYTDLKIADRTQIEFFDGPHTINGVGTFDFLHEHLHWPQGK